MVKDRSYCKRFVISGLKKVLRQYPLKSSLQKRCEALTRRDRKTLKGLSLYAKRSRAPERIRGHAGSCTRDCSGWYNELCNSLRMLDRVRSFRLQLTADPLVQFREREAIGPDEMRDAEVRSVFWVSADAKKGAESDKTNSEGDTKILQIAEKLGDDVDKQMNLEEKTVELDQDQAGLDPSKTHESRPLPEQVFMDEDQARPDPGESRVALAGPDPEPTNDEFIANVYPNVQESLKFSAEEHVILEEPLSLSGTLSSMKNLDDAYTIGDQFINDKATEDEPEKLNVESEVVSMVTVLIYQASASVPPLFTPVIDNISLLKPAYLPL
ncbi:hypothetical protein Tco_0929704 [Tanacetum coccineum]